MAELQPSREIERDGQERQQVGPTAAGLLWGLIGVVAFSFTLPATGLALHDLSPVMIGLGRAAVAGLVAPIILIASREALPPTDALPRLAILGGCVLIAFPFLTSLALERAPVSHGAIVISLLPSATAVTAVWRAAERPSIGFWIASVSGLLAVLAFAAIQGAGLPRLQDVWLLGAVAFAAIGYTEGGALARRLGGWKVMLWAVTLAAPLVVPVGIFEVLHTSGAIHPTSWLGYAYLSLVSVFLGLVAWYRGMAHGGVARIAQLQLGQPILTLTWAVLLLGEHVDLATMGAALLVLTSLVATQRTRVDMTMQGERQR